MRTLHCPKCQGSLTRGFLLERNAKRGNSAAEWVEGEPVRGWFGVKLLGKTKLTVESWRCGRCGYLENYAK